MTNQSIPNTFINETGSALSTCYENATSLALDEYLTLCLIKVELTIPEGASCVNKEMLLEFAEYFQATVNKERINHVNKCHARFVWDTPSNKNQLIVILNRKAYPNITNYCSNIRFIANTIEASWAATFGVTLRDLRQKVKYPIHAVSYLSVKCPENQN